MIWKEPQTKRIQACLEPHGLRPPPPVRDPGLNVDDIYHGGDYKDNDNIVKFTLLHYKDRNYIMTMQW